MLSIEGLGYITASWHTDPETVSKAIPISQVTSRPPAPGIYVKPSLTFKWAGILTPKTYDALVNFGQLVSKETCQLFIPKNSQWLICHFCNPGPPHPFDWSVIHPALQAVTASWWAVNKASEEAKKAYTDELVKNLKAIDWGRKVPEKTFELGLSNIFTWGLVGVGAFIVGRQVKKHWKGLRIKRLSWEEAKGKKEEEK